ncbi:hypothetical protein ACFQJC_13605 [Haloferax namakaokahaiae]|uniref:Uncharacterized protein n=1 Tax=Haloferax namakaokahaiae TaxID=1748331 RepID=A0ABD5ZH53_9EURY
MPSSDPPSTQKQALVTALQWGLVQAFFLDTVGRLLENYYEATTGASFPPDWVFSIQVAAPLALVVGGYGGYRWVTSGRASTSAAAHRSRILFVGALVVGWALAIVPTMAFQLLLGDRLHTVPFFLLPTLTAIFVFAGAYLLAYRVDSDWYRRHRNRLLGTVRGAIVGLIFGMVGFSLYGSYLVATRTNFSLDGGPGIVAAVCLGAIAGYGFADRERDESQIVEFLVVFVSAFLVLTLLLGLGITAMAIVGLSVPDFGFSFVVTVLPAVCALGLAGYLTYRVETSFSRRLFGR